MTINSNPPGALVLVDGKEIGYTPAGVDFTYYATREIMLVKPGFETHTELVEINAPWYQIPPIDFVSDNFLPTRITDRRNLSFQLKPQVVTSTQELLDRAGNLRSEAQTGP